MTPRNLLVLTAALLTLSSAAHARPEFFVRPVAQYTWLPAASRKSDAKHTEYLTSNVPVSISSRDYTASAGSFGGGVAVGVTVGTERRFELGAEFTTTRFDGVYTTPEYSGTYSPTSTTTVPVYSPGSKQACSFSVRTIMASIRRNFGKRDDRVRPYLGFVAGSLEYDITEKERPSGFRVAPFNGSYGYLAAGLGGGAKAKLGKYVSIDVSYRFMYSGNGIFDRDGFYRTGHILNLGLEMHF